MSLDSGEMWHNPHASGVTTTRRPLAVLFVDPDHERAKRLADSIRATCTVEAVTSVRNAAEAITRRVPDLVILDLEQRDGGSIEFITYLQGMSATRHTLIMVLSQRATVREKISALAAGADDYVVWPIDPQAFALRVQLLGRFRRTLTW